MSIHDTAIVGEAIPMLQSLWCNCCATAGTASYCRVPTISSICIITEHIYKVLIQGIRCTTSSTQYWQSILTDVSCQCTCLTGIIRPHNPYNWLSPFTESSCLFRQGYFLYTKLLATVLHQSVGSGMGMYPKD